MIVRRISAREKIVASGFGVLVRFTFEERGCRQFTPGAAADFRRGETRESPHDRRHLKYEAAAETVGRQTGGDFTDTLSRERHRRKGSRLNRI